MLTDDVLAALNPWVIEGRYPGDLDEATPEVAAELVALADQALTHLAATIDQDG